VTTTAASVAAEAEWLRDSLDALALAAELRCEVALHPSFAGIVEAFRPAPGIYVLVGTPEEIRAEVRRQDQQEPSVLGGQE
jgi:hypothetical protein